MVSAFLKTLPHAPSSTYNIILNNLFVFIKLLIYFLAEDFGACGTTRINAGVY